MATALAPGSPGSRAGEGAAPRTLSGLGMGSVEEIVDGAFVFYRRRFLAFGTGQQHLGLDADERGGHLEELARTVQTQDLDAPAGGLEKQQQLPTFTFSLNPRPIGRAPRGVSVTGRRKCSIPFRDR